MLLDAIETSLRTLRIALPKIGVGWMFALLTIDFARIAIVELGIAALIVTALLSIHYFVSPFQIVAGRFADRHPILGYRRSPYLIIATAIASGLFMLLPGVALAIATNSAIAIALGVLLFFAFGLCVATIGDCHHALIAEITTEKNRAAVISVVWITMILSTIVAAVVMNKVRPVYTPELMQDLYNLTPLIAIPCAILGTLGIERRMTPVEAAAAAERARLLVPPGNPFVSTARLLRRSPETRAFAAFIFVSIFAIFLQDNILEVFGAEVFGMSVAETTRFQPTWGSGVLLGMIFMGAFCYRFTVSRRTMVVVGCVGTSIAMLALGAASVFGIREAVFPCLFAMGLLTGVFNVGALSMMMEMTVPGATGMYMGLWGMSQVLAQGVASLSSGALHTALVGTGFMTPGFAFGAIFGLEAAALVGAALILLGVNAVRFRDTQSAPLTRADLTRTMDATA